jgi:AraC-like DNA-binding protein
MLRTFRNFEVPELNAFHRSVELKCAGFRIGRHETQRMMSDYGLLDKVSPFVNRLTLSAVSIVLEGEARFEESGRRLFVKGGSLVGADQNNCATEAYAPTTTAGAGAGAAACSAAEGANARSVFLFVDWDPKVFGGGIKSFEDVRLTELDRTRLAACASDLVRATTTAAAAAKVAAEIISILRAAGLPMTKLTSSDLAAHASATTTPEDQRLVTALDIRLSNMESHPSLDEIASDLGWSDRHTNRRIGQLVDTDTIPWAQWRTWLRAVRLMNAFRVLSLPEATTELAAKKAGFRSPTALCHAFTKANLPSPGALSKACQSGGLDAWTPIVDRRLCAA